MGNKASSFLTYCFLLAISLVTLFWGQHLSLTHQDIRVWDWAAWLPLLIGMPFILLQKEAGLPEVWEASISNKKRLLIPFSLGLFFGLLDIIVVQIILHPQPYTSLPPFLQPFPYSVALYSAGACEVEVFHRLIPLTLILWLGGKLLLKNKNYNTIFWIVAILTALWEPLEQFPEGAWWFIIYSLVSGFAMNLLQAIYFKKAGFLASLMIRLGHYLLWHILLGIYIECVQLG